MNSGPVVTVVATLGVAWLVLAAAMLIATRRSDRALVARVARLVPDTVRLLRRLLSDPAVARRVRWRLLLAVVYNIQPFNLIPDFIPIIGFADNVIVTAWALRGVVRACGDETIEQHWPGSEEGLALLYRVLSIPQADAPVAAGSTSRRESATPD